MTLEAALTSFLIQPFIDVPFGASGVGKPETAKTTEINFTDEDDGETWRGLKSVQPSSDSPMRCVRIYFPWAYLKRSIRSSAIPSPQTIHSRKTSRHHTMKEHNAIDQQYGAEKQTSSFLSTRAWSRGGLWMVSRPTSEAAHHVIDASRAFGEY